MGRTFSFTRSSSTTKGSGELPSARGPGTEGDEAAGSALSSAAGSLAATPRGSEAGTESSAFYNPYKATAMVLQQQLAALQVGRMQGLRGVPAAIPIAQNRAGRRELASNASLSSMYLLSRCVPPHLLC